MSFVFYLSYIEFIYCSGLNKQFVLTNTSYLYESTLSFLCLQAQKLENKKIREKEMATLKREMAARAKSERELKESEERLRQMQEAMENHQRELQEARDTIARLEAQLRETQVRGSIGQIQKT